MSTKWNLPDPGETSGLNLDEAGIDAAAKKGSSYFRYETGNGMCVMEYSGITLIVESFRTSARGTCDNFSFPEESRPDEVRFLSFSVAAATRESPIGIIIMSFCMSWRGAAHRYFPIVPSRSGKTSFF